MKKFFKSSFAPFICIPMAAVYFLLLFQCAPSYPVKTQPFPPPYDMKNDPRWPEFEKCVGDEISDSVCDSCYHKVFQIPEDHRLY
jgi:hypothetical protein